MAAIERIIQNLLFSIIQLFVGLFVSTGAVYMGLKLFAAFTREIDEMKELKRGNAAVGILVAAVIISMAVVLEPQVSRLFAEVIGGLSGSVISIEKITAAIIVGLLRLAIGIIAAVVSVYIALTVLSRITSEIDEQKELARGNIAVAILVGGILIAVSFVIKAGVAAISGALDPLELAVALNFKM